MKHIRLTTALLLGSLLLSPGAMAYGSDLLPGFLSGHGLFGSQVQGPAWKFDADNLLNIFRPTRRPDHPVFGDNGGRGKPGKGNPNPGRPANPGNGNPGKGHGGAHAVPEMDAAGGIIAFSLMLGLFGLFRERRRAQATA